VRELSEVERLQVQVQDLQAETDELKLDIELNGNSISEQHAELERLKLTVEKLVSGLVEANVRAESAERRIKELEEKVKTNE
jgi:chromosome segregation ATPase